MSVTREQLLDFCYRKPNSYISQMLFAGEPPPPEGEQSGSPPKESKKGGKEEVPPQQEGGDQQEGGNSEDDFRMEVIKRLTYITKKVDEMSSGPKGIPNLGTPPGAPPPPTGSTQLPPPPAQ